MKPPYRFSSPPSADLFEYDFETLLCLEKATGRVTCDKPELAARAQAELDRCLDARTAGDVTRVVQRLFERQADLFPIREQGGAYFVPQRHVDLVDKVETFLRSLNGQIHRFPIPTGTSQGDRSVKDAVAGGIAALIAEHEAAIATFTEDTRPSTLERAAEQIRITRYKIESYACYLAEQKAHLERDLAAARRNLRAKVEQLAAETEPAHNGRASRHGTLLSGASA